MEALESSQRLGMLGERPVHEAVEHAGAFVAALVDVHGVVVDLGSGGGVPGLVVAVARPDLRVVLVDRRATRTDHLARLVRRLDLEAQVMVRRAEAMTLTLPFVADAVVARSFGPPEVTARAAARLLGPGGLLVVSEPPDAEDRWTATVSFARMPWADRRVAVLRRIPGAP